MQQAEAHKASISEHEASRSIQQQAAAKQESNRVGGRQVQQSPAEALAASRSDSENHKHRACVTLTAGKQQTSRVSTGKQRKPHPVVLTRRQQRGEARNTKLRREKQRA
jgi:hypothetical protein